MLPASVARFRRGQAPTWLEHSTSRGNRTWSSARGAFSWKKHGSSPIPGSPEALAAYIVERVAKGHLKIGTMSVRLTVIGIVHKRAKHPNPFDDVGVKDIWAGVRRKYGAPPNGKAAAAASEIIKLIDAGSASPSALADARDKALLLIGFAGAFRRSELVGIRLEDLSWRENGVVIHLGKSKTDQQGHGRDIGIASTEGEFCPVSALKAWLELAGIESGPVFRSLQPNNRGLRANALTPGMVARIVKERALRAGLDAERFSAHSLRSGHVTEAFARGVALDQIMSTTGHTTMEMALRYKRADPLAAGSSQHLGVKREETK